MEQIGGTCAGEMMWLDTGWEPAVAAWQLVSLLDESEAPSCAALWCLHLHSCVPAMCRMTRVKYELSTHTAMTDCI